MDLQRIAMELAYGQQQAQTRSSRAASAMMAGSGSGGGGDKRRWNTPGLGLVCATFLKKRLDKTEQCSDWDQRPLSESQVAYAAADAAVLIEIAAAMGGVA
eukprot:COSAG06_NODE_61_length_27084_cov_48.281490_28_plen_101_part_00